MEQFPFAVDNADSPIVAAAAGGDDSSSLVTASSQGSFVPTSEEDNGGGGMMTMMMHSSLQPHTDDEHNHDAVFANLTPPLPALTVAAGTVVQQPHLLPMEEPIHLGATIVELPPPSPQVLPGAQRAPSTTSTRSAPQVVNTSTTTAPSSLLSGVDALKSAGSRVTSVLSTLGYNLGMNSNSSTSVPTSTAPTVRMSNTTQTPVSTISKQHYEPQQPENNSPTLATTLEEGANDFAYINVTDEDEVDIWLDEHHANTYREDSSFPGSNGHPEAGRRGNILAVLLANDVSPPISMTDHNYAAAPLTATPGDQLIQFTEGANTMSWQAVQARKIGNLQTALDRHSDAAKLYHQAAVQIRDRDGTCMIFKHTFMSIHILTLFRQIFHSRITGCVIIAVKSDPSQGGVVVETNY